MPVRNLQNGLSSMGRALLPAPYRSRSLWLGGLVIVIIMWGLKYHYSTATASQLDWILAPTAGMVRWLTDVSYTPHAGIGYISENRQIIIAPACAGLNFMIMAFGLTALTGLGECQSPREKALWLSAMLIGAYSATLIINTLRILLSVFLYQSGISLGWLTPERLHRIAGIGFYFGFLALYSASVKLIMPVFQRWGTPVRPTPSPVSGSWPPGLFQPLGWYLLGAVVVPLLNPFYSGRPIGEIEHYLTVILVSLVICMIAKTFSKMRL